MMHTSDTAGGKDEGAVGRRGRARRLCRRTGWYAENPVSYPPDLNRIGRIFIEDI